MTFLPDPKNEVDSYILMSLVKRRPLISGPGENMVNLYIMKTEEEDHVLGRGKISAGGLHDDERQ